MLGVVGVIGKREFDQLGALAGGLVGDEGINRRGVGQEAGEVEGEAADERGVTDRLRAGDLVFGEVAVEDAVDRMFAAVNHRRQLGPARLEGRLVGQLSKAEAGFPFHPFVDPLFQHLHLLGRHARAFRGHPFGLVVGQDRLDEQALVGLAKLHHRAVLGTLDQRFAGVHREAALFRGIHVAFRAVLLEDGHHLVGEVDFGLHEREKDRN